MSVYAEYDINVPYTYGENLAGKPPRPNTYDSVYSTDSDARMLVMSANLPAVTEAVAKLRIAGVIQSDSSPYRLMARVITAEQQKKNEEAQRKYLLQEQEKAKKLAEEAKQRQTEDAKRFRKIMMTSVSEEEEGVSEWDIFMRGGLSMDELFTLATVVKPAKDGLSAPSLPRQSALALAC